jgi:putative DNA primase/helicase
MSNNSKSAGKGNPPRKRTADLGVGYTDQHFGKRFIFPIAAGKKFPPCIKNNLEDASNDPKQIAEWERKWPGCNWGVAHRKSKLLVADVDVNKAKGKTGQATFDDLDLMYGWPATETTTTPSGGMHLIYEGWADDNHPEHIMALGENGIGKDIDSPNYTLIPGCTFDDGTSYVGNGVDAVRCPEWIYDTIRNSKTKSRIADAGEIVVELDQQANITLAIDFLENDAVPSIQGENGDANLLKAAYYLKDIGISQQLGAELLNEYFNPRCEPSWDMADLVKKMAGAYSYANLSKVGGKTAEADFADDKPEPITLSPKKAAKVEKAKVERKKNASTFGLDYVMGNDIEPTTIDWIWTGVLSLGKHTLIAGVQGDGKSQVVYSIAAAVTTGSKWPGSEERAPQGYVILFNAEDTPEDMMAPRLIAAGADMRFIIIMKAVKDESGKRKFNLIDDLERLTKLANKIRAENPDTPVQLIAFDPISSYLGGDLDSHSNTELRNALDPMGQMAYDTGAAVLSVSHLNKSGTGVNALNRVMGGAGFTAAPRAAFAVIRDAEKPLVRMMLPLKTNITSDAEKFGMCFTLGQGDGGTDKRTNTKIIAPMVVWGDKTTMTADEALRAQNEKLRKPTKFDKATDFIEQALAAGPKLSKEMEAAAERAGIAYQTLRRAREDLGVISTKLEQPDGRGPWQWSLPVDDEFEDARADFVESADDLM